ncbi:MAG: hypothetical protein H5U38_11790 [Calditrichaeota bacterium]|nr:hypothetical protein [Calditrichota bacterium]
MRLLRHSRYYSCSLCSSKFLTTADERIFVLRNGLLRGRKAHAAELWATEAADALPKEQVPQAAQDDGAQAAPAGDFRRLRTQLLLDLRGELVPWMRKRFWIAMAVGVVLGLVLIHLTVRAMLTSEFRAAMSKAAKAEQAAQELQTQAAFYKELVGELDAQIRKSEDALRQMEARIAAMSGAVGVVPPLPASRSGASEALMGDEANANGTSLLEETARKQLMQENAAYKVIVFASRGQGDLLAQKVVERLQADNYRVASVILPPSEQGRARVEMECTIEAAQKAKEVREVVTRLAALLGQGSREVTLRYNIAEGVTAGPPEKREIRIFF